MSDGPPTEVLFPRAQVRAAGAAAGDGARSRPEPASHTQWFESDPLWYQRAVFYEVLVRGFFDSNDDGTGDLAGLTEKLDYLEWLGRRLHLAAALLPSPLRDGGYDISDFFTHAPGVRRHRTTPRARRGSPPAGHAHHRRPGDEPHERPAPVVPGEPPGPHQPEGRLVRVERRRPALERRAGHLRRHRAVELDAGTRVAGQYFWHRFFHHQPDLNYDNPEVAGGDARRRAASGSTSASTASASTPCPTSSSGTAPTARTSPRPTSTCGASARRSTPSSPAGCCSPRPTSGRATSSTTSATGDECHMCFHFPLMPRMFMAVRREQRYPITEILASTPDDPRRLPVGDLPAQPRRADARDGHRRGAGLHVRRVRQRPADEAQHRHPAPAVPAPRQRPPDRRAVPRPAVLAAGARRSSTTATRSAWATTSTSATATACARRCSGSPDRNAGFSRADFAQLYLPPLMDPVYGYQAVNVEAQQRDPTSFLHWLRRMLEVRAEHPVFGIGPFSSARRREPVGARLPAGRDDGRRRALRQQPQPLRPAGRAAARRLRRGRIPRSCWAGSRSRRIGELPYFVTLAALRLLLVRPRGS